MMDLHILTESETAPGSTPSSGSSGGGSGSASGAAGASSGLGGSSAGAGSPIPGLDQYAGAKMKLDELFLYWLAQKETRGLIAGYLGELKEGKTLDVPSTSLAATYLAGKQAAATAPVSPLRGRNSPPPRSPTRSTSPPGGQKHFTFDDVGFGSPKSAERAAAAKAAAAAKEAAAGPAGTPEHSAAPGSGAGDAGGDGSSPMRPAVLDDRFSGKGSEDDEAAAAKTDAGDEADKAADGDKAAKAGATAAAGEKAGATSSPAKAGATSPATAKGAADADAAGKPPKPEAVSSPKKVSAHAPIPPFYAPGEGGRGRGRPLPDETLEKKLDLIVEVWRATNAGRPANATPERATHPKLGDEEGKGGDKGGAPPTAPEGYEWHEGVCVKTGDLDIGLRVEQFAAVAKTLCGFPSFFAAPLFRRIRLLFPSDEAKAAKAAAEGKEAAEGKAEGKDAEGKAGDGAAAGGAAATGEEGDEGEIKLRTFFKYWRAEMQPYDHTDRFFRLVKQVGAPGIVKSDLLPFMEELLAFHPGLAFLENTPEFQEKYARTVIARMFYMLDPDNRRVITARALRRSNLLSAFHTVDMEEDINLVNEYFSYEHFYVLYCKFWELDKDHDFLLSREDLTPLGGHALTNAILDRLFDQAGRPFESEDSENRMGFEDFVCLLLSEEDKTNEISLRYWFRTIDLDGDGVIRAFEMRHFYAEQMQRMEDLNCEVVPFEDIMCQMHDLLQPEVEGEFRFEDFLKPDRIRLTGVFFSVLFNLSKFTAFEQRDPFVVKQQQDPGFTAWDRYAQIEYARLALEEEAQDDDLLDGDDGNAGIGGWGADDDDDGMGDRGSSESPF